MTMIETLRRIVQEVETTPDFSEAMRLLVVRVREAMNTEVCSVYIYDEENNRYLLMATEGLNPDAVGNVSLAASQGLVGLDRKSTRLNSSHVRISYAVFCLKKKI